MSQAGAWLLDLGENLYAAVGERELRYLLTDPPSLTIIPNSPPYCRTVLVWQGAVVPVMDLAHRVLGRVVTRSHKDEVIVLATFQEHTQAPIQYGALLLGSIPTRLSVNDNQVCHLPDPKPLWQRLACSCFQHEIHGPVPILNLTKVFLTTGDSEGS